MTAQFVSLALIILFLTGTLIGLHAVRLRYSRDLFMVFIGFLWFFSFLIGHIDLSITIPGDESAFRIRYSTTIYTLIFVGALIAYIAEGVKAAQILIIVSVLSQVSILVLQVTIHSLAMGGVPESMLNAATSLFTPAYGRFAVSLIAGISCLYLSVLFYQWLKNHAAYIPDILKLFLALFLPLLLDGVLFTLGTRPSRFFQSLPENLAVKGVISALVTPWVYWYLYRLQKETGTTLQRGTFDIFRKIENLESDLAVANAELKAYAADLEKKVEHRTREIRAKQQIIDFELDMAAEVQRAMLPEKSEAGGLIFAADYIPMSKVSGDFYQFWEPSPGVQYIFLADVSGHGPPAAMVAAAVNMVFSRLANESAKPAAILTQISAEILSLGSNQYLTAALLKLNIHERRIIYANGAHPAPILISEKNEILRLEPTGSIIGAQGMEEMEFKEISIRIPANTRIVLFSDGLTEHKGDAEDDYGEHRLIELLKRTRSRKVEEIVPLIREDVVRHSNGKEFRDDYTLLMIDIP